MISKKKGFLFLGISMMLFAIIFVWFALNHPESSFPWNNIITYIFYFLYAIVMTTCLVMSKRIKWTMIMPSIKSVNKISIGKLFLSTIYFI